MVGTADESQGLYGVMMKTAIIIRGQARTWHLTKSNTFDLFSDIYGDIHWYFVTEDTGTVSHDSLAADFAGRDLRGCILAPSNGYQMPNGEVEDWRSFIPAYWKLAWMDLLISRLKRQQEMDHGFTYNNVLFLRTDCWYMHLVREPMVRKLLHPMSVSTIGCNGSMDMDDHKSDDLFYRAGAAAADLLLLRWYDGHIDMNCSQQLVHGNSQVNLANYVTRNFITHDEDAGTFHCTIIRPDHVDEMPWSVAKHDPAHTDSKTWYLRSKEDKRAWCERLGISPIDYDLS